MTDTTDIRVIAIRADKRVGVGSCSTIDECFTDAELIADMNEDGVVGGPAAVQWALEYEALRLGHHVEMAFAYGARE